MRTLLAILISVSFLSAKAQTHLSPGGYFNYTQWSPFSHYDQLADSAYSGKKWYLSRYAGLSAGYSSFAGGTSFLSVPVGLQLNHPLNNNLYAFAGISATPVFFNSNLRYTGQATGPYHPGYDFSRTYGSGLNSRVELGLMYVNDAKTFSISGSIGAERSSYPAYSPNREPMKKQN